MRQYQSLIPVAECAPVRSPDWIRVTTVSIHRQPGVDMAATDRWNGSW